MGMAVAEYANFMASNRAKVMSYRLIRGVGTASLGLACVLGAFAQETDSAAVLLDVKRFEIVGQNPLSAGETEKLLAPHLGAKSDLRGLEAASAALEQELRDQGYAFYRVIIPAQKPVDGVVRLQILSFPLGKVAVTGNQHFSNESILRALPELEIGKSPDVAELSRQLTLANEHPAKRLSLLFKEGASRDTIDADVRTRDQSPQQFFVNLTAQTSDEYNQINQNTGYSRLTLGYQRSDLFGLDHALTATYTTSPEEPSRVKQYGLFYWVPFYGYNTSLTAYYARSDINTGTIGTESLSFAVNGQGKFWGLKLNYALPKIGETIQNLSLAVDDKFFHSGVIVDVAVEPIADVRSRPLSLRYSARYDKTWGSVGGYVEYSRNLSGGEANDNDHYEDSRSSSSGTARASWHAYHLGFDATYASENGWGLSAKARGQYANKPLISGELFGLGGVGSVRGLRDREFAGDQGVTLSFEAIGPALVDTLRPVVFYDWGEAHLVAPLSTTLVGDLHQKAASVGIGARWQWRNQLDLSADLARVVDGVSGSGTTPGTPAGHTKLNMSLFYRF